MTSTRTKAGSSGLLDGLGLVGLGEIEPVVIAAVAAELPILLVGPHGTGKSLLLTRIAEALGLTWRHYNASLLSYDDLVGYPVPDGHGGLDWLRTPATIWDAEAVFLDEINRCRPELQNKLFPHRSGTAPPHQLAPPTTRVAIRLIGCPPRFAHGRRSRAGRPTGPPPPVPPPRSRRDRNGETRPRAHDWEARTSRRTVFACGDPRSASPAPLVELHERQRTAQLPMSNGAPPAASGTT